MDGHLCKMIEEINSQCITNKIIFNSFITSHLQIDYCKILSLISCFLQPMLQEMTTGTEKQ